MRNAACAGRKLHQQKSNGCRRATKWLKRSFSRMKRFRNVSIYRFTETKMKRIKLWCNSIYKRCLKFLVLTYAMETIFANTGFTRFEWLVRRSSIIMATKYLMYRTLGRNGKDHYQHHE